MALNRLTKGAIPYLYPSDIDTKETWHIFDDDPPELEHWVTSGKVGDSHDTLERRALPWGLREIGNLELNIPLDLPRTITRCKWLVAIEIWGCVFPDNSFDRLCVTLNVCPHIQSVVMHDIDFIGGSDTQQRHAEHHLAFYIRQSRSLRKFEWHTNYMTEDAYKGLLEAIGKNRSIIYLAFKVRNNACGSEADWIRILGDAIVQNRTLQYVSHFANSDRMLHGGLWQQHPSLRAIALDFSARSYAFTEEHLAAMAAQISELDLRKVILSDVPARLDVWKHVQRAIWLRRKRYREAMAPIALILCAYRLGDEGSTLNIFPLELVHMIIRHYVRAINIPPLEFETHIQSDQ